jgi:cardiolipin synthase
MNVPNLLTVSRFFMVPVYLLCFFFVDRQLAFWVIMLAGITDILDGYIARSRNLITETGALLDPLADKTLVVVVIATLVLDGSMNGLIGVILCLRELGMIIGGTMLHYQGKQTVSANAFGKITTVFYYVLFFLMFYGWLDRQYTDLLFLGLILLSLLVTIRYLLGIRKANAK